MALTQSQRDVCRLVAENRRRSGESYVAASAALNLLAGARRVSRNTDRFHDTLEALESTWAADASLLRAAGYDVAVARERPGFVEAVVSRTSDSVLLQWTRDSAFRFYPLVEHEDFGLVLHPFDLATNKVLALVGRLEVRDWVDTIACDAAVQPWGTWRGRRAARIRASARHRSWSMRDDPRATRQSSCGSSPSTGRLRMPRRFLPGGTRCSAMLAGSSTCCPLRRRASVCWAQAALCTVAGRQSSAGISPPARCGSTPAASEGPSRC